MSEMQSAISNPQSTISNLPIRQRLRTSLWLASSLLWCLLGQYYLTNLPQFRWDAAIFYALGLFSFWRVLVRAGVVMSPAPRPDDAPFEPVAGRWPLVFVSAGLAMVAYWACANNTFTRLGVLAWIGAVALFMLAMWPRTPTPSLTLPRIGGGLGGGLTIRLRWRTVALIAIIALAAFFRLYRLDQVPP